MNKQVVEGFFGNPFFVGVVKSKPDKDFLIQQLKNCKKELDDDWNYRVFSDLCRFFKALILDQTNSPTNPYLSIFILVLVNAFSECDLLQYFCDNEEDVSKIVDIIKREQVNSKILKSVSARISYFLSAIDYDSKSLYLALYMSVKSKISDYTKKHILKTMGPLKKVIEQVASGVIDQCYLDFERQYRSDISNELDEYIKTTYGYSLNNYNYDYLIRKTDIDILSLAVVNDEDFWHINDDFAKKSIIQFAGIAAKYNSFSHATKIVDYAFKKVCEDKKCLFLFNNKLPLYLSDNLEMKMADSCAEIIERRFGKLFNFKLTDYEKQGLVYPIFSGYEAFVKEGKEIFERFITKAYCNDSSKIFEVFSDLNNLIQDESVNKNSNRRKIKLREYLEFELIGWDNERDIKEKYLSSYYDNYELDESVLGRFFYRLYLLSKFSKAASEECLFEYLFDMLSMIDEKYGTKCIYGFDQSLRDNSYEGLKNLLHRYNIIINDDYRENYVIALLDRKCASIMEASKFAELEQLGDAIYELAIYNIIFYHPNSDIKLDHSNVDKYVKATSQVDVAKTIGIDKLYISKLHSKLNTKFIFDEGYEINSIGNGDEKYIADSLEMVIGAVAKEFTVQKALDFATEIILETNKELRRPEFVENFDIEALFKSNYDKDYLAKIYPSLFSNDDSEYLYEYHMLWRSINKIARIMVLGNDTKEKRTMIAHSLSEDIIPKNNKVDWTTLVANYLYFGIDITIEKCKAIIIESNYSK